MCDECLLDPKMDFIFKRIFGNENQPEILIRFLNAIFEAKETTKEYDPIVWVEIKNTEIPKESNDSKASILDIRATTSKGEIINIEIQRSDEGNILQRALFYLCRMFIEQLGAGGKYEKLEKAVSIVITDFETDFIKSTHFHNYHNFFNEVELSKLTDLLELHFIELPKMKSLDENDILQLFLQFLKDPQDATVEEKSAEVVELSKAKAELKRLSIDPDTRYEFELRERTLKDMNSALSYREAKGKAEGIAIGQAKAKAKVDKAEKAKAKAEKAKAQAEAKAKEAESKVKEAEAKVKEAELKTKLDNAKNLLSVLDDETIANSLGLEVSQVADLRKEVES